MHIFIFDAHQIRPLLRVFAVAATLHAVSPLRLMAQNLSQGIYTEIRGGGSFGGRDEICVNDRKATDRLIRVGQDAVSCAMTASTGNGFNTYNVQAAEARASNEGSILRVSTRATVFGSGALPNQSTGYQTIAGAGWIDGLRFAPGRQPAFASFAVYVNGGVFASRAGGNTVSSGRVSARASLTVWNALNQSGTDALQQQVAAAAGSPIVVEEASVNRLLRVMIPVPRIDRTTLTFNYFLNVFAGAESGGQQTAFGGGEAQFMNSAGLESILFFDEDMQQITEGVNYEFLGGTVLTPNTVVPEPQTWMLLGVGLLAIGAHARSRQGSARQGATA